MSCWFVEEVGRSSPSTRSTGMLQTVCEGTGKKPGWTAGLQEGRGLIEGHDFQMAHGKRHGTEEEECTPPLHTLSGETTDSKVLEDHSSLRKTGTVSLQHSLNTVHRLGTQTYPPSPSLGLHNSTNKYAVIGQLCFF